MIENIHSFKSFAEVAGAEIENEICSVRPLNGIVRKKNIDTYLKIITLEAPNNNTLW